MQRTAPQHRLGITFSLATWDVLPRAMCYFALGGLSRGIKDIPFRVAILSTLETPSVSTSVALSCIALPSANFVTAATWMPSNATVEAHFRGLRIVPLLMLPSAAQRHWLGIAFSSSRPCS
jgi:hypothetical protein